MSYEVKILTDEPIIEVVAEMGIRWDGVREMAKWVKSHRPECLPDGFDPEGDGPISSLFPHDMEGQTDNELLVELAGRKCYDSFGLKAGRKSNKEYIEHTQMLTDPKETAAKIEMTAYGTGLMGGGSQVGVGLRHSITEALEAERDRVPHASILYHAKMTFFIAGISRRVSQEIFRNYVGSNSDMEGNPSQESSRYTHHYGTFVAHPQIVDDPEELELYRQSVQRSYNEYVEYIDRKAAKFEKENKRSCTGMDRKRIYESSIGRMPWDFETSFIWTTNPGALMKFFKERCSEASDLEMQRFAKKWRRICLEYWPNLFPGVKA